MNKAKQILNNPNVNNAAKRLVADELLALRKAATALDALSSANMILNDDPGYLDAIRKARTAHAAIKQYLDAYLKAYDE